MFRLLKKMAVLKGWFDTPFSGEKASFKARSRNPVNLFLYI